VFSNDTERFFAWTIDPPLSAAFMGSGFGAGFVLVVLVRRRDRWVDVRLSFVSVFGFAVLTLVATLIHIDRFHFDSGGAAEFAAWLWLVVYVVVPIAMAVLLIRQHRTAGHERQATPPLPGWLRAVLAIEGVVTMVVGGVMFVTGSLDAWPWPLTPLIARALAGWLIPLGLAALLALREDDLARLRAPGWAYVVFASLLGIALARFGGPVRWSTAPAWMFMLWLLALLMTGAYGVSTGRSVTPRDGTEQPKVTAT
jgi:hypothetical protein